jgi:glyoxylase-like metal-dependent hydrolase (beta-lactamase superfamily II)
VNEIEIFETFSGTPIYQIPIEAFPGLLTYAYLVVHEDYNVLIDTGSGVGEAADQFLDGVQQAGRLILGKKFSFEALTHILITHGHIDHYGGLKEICKRTNALVGVHELDRRNITNFLERRTINLHILGDYLIKAGVNGEKRGGMLDFYRYTMRLFDSVDVDFGFEEINMQLDPFRFLHVPGHSGGHVVISLDDVLFCGDHVLTDITPHQAPEELSSWCGLNHYLRSLDLLEGWAGDVNLSLCGHKRAITDLRERISEIKQMHFARLDEVMQFYKSPNTIDALSESLFGKAYGFDALLAIEEAGAHVEYLYQRGRLRINNFNHLEPGSRPVAFHYQARDPNN